MDRSIAIVVSRYNDDITSKLLEGAQRTLLEGGIGAERIDVRWVPGAWEIPLAAKWLADRNRYAAIICLGAVIQGQTTHDRHINRFVSQAIGSLSLQYAMPIAFGVLTCSSRELAAARAGGNKGNKGVEAARAALDMLQLRTDLDD